MNTETANNDESEENKKKSIMGNSNEADNTDWEFQHELNSKLYYPY